MSHDRVVAIAGCWRGVETSHVELLAVDAVEDTGGAEDWIVERAGRKIPVVIDTMSPAASMIPSLEARKVKVKKTSAADMARACGGFYDSVLEGRVTHGGQEQLDAALAGARKRTIGQAGGWGWDRKDDQINIAPLVAATLAHFGAASARKRERTGQAAFR
jgi:hypothetical protein